MNNTAKIFTALAAGVAAGAVLGVLFAPDKGSETRKKIGEQGKKMANGFKTMCKDGKEKFSHLKEEVEGKVKEKMEEYA